MSTQTQQKSGAVSRSAARKARALSQEKYRPRSKPAPAAPAHMISDDELRRIARGVLESLQRPDAIPSEAILAGLRAVRERAERILLVNGGRGRLA